MSGAYGEPWRIEGFNGKLFIVDSRDFTRSGKDHLQRMVDCVNACAGMEDPEAEVKRLRTTVAAVEHTAEVLQDRVNELEDQLQRCLAGTL